MEGARETRGSEGGREEGIEGLREGGSKVGREKEGERERGIAGGGAGGREV